MKNKLIDSLLLGSLLITGILLCSLLITGCKNKDNDSFNSNNTIKSIDSNGVIKTETVETIDTSYLLGKTYKSYENTLSIDTNGKVISKNNNDNITNYTCTGFIDGSYIIFTEDNMKNYNYPKSSKIVFIGTQSLILENGTTYILDNVNKIENISESDTISIEPESTNKVDNIDNLNSDDFITYLNELSNKMPNIGDSYSIITNIQNEINQKYKYNAYIYGYGEGMDGNIEQISNPHICILGSKSFNDLESASNYFDVLSNFILNHDDFIKNTTKSTSGTYWKTEGYIMDLYGSYTSVYVKLQKNKNNYNLEFYIPIQFKEV